MKIGILTWFFGNNYGARAHSYALQQIFRNMGHECYMINYVPADAWKSNIIMNLNCGQSKKHPILAVRCLIRCIKFNKQRKIYNLSDKVKCAEDINKLGLDAVEIGSDEIFKLDHPFCSDIYFGVGINTSKFMYAPSSGQTPEDAVLSIQRTNSIKKMEGIAVRDKHTQQLIYNNCNKNALIVLDPTLLYDFSELISQNIHEKDYILIYSFSQWNEYKNKIQAYARQKQLKIVCVGRYCKWADKSYDTADLSTWIGLFSKASLVVTDSFHGVVFAIKFHKQMLIFGRGDKLNKINDLLNTLQVCVQFYAGEKEVELHLIDNSIDYRKVDVILDRKKEKSEKYIQLTLDKISKRGV